MIRLPQLIRCHRIPFAYGLIWLPYIALYQATNRWPLFPPQQLELTALDRAIPFVPELLFIYVAYIPYYWWTVARIEDETELNRVFYATHFQLAASLVFFVAFPVRMPRELFYSAELYNWADGFWRWFDEPNNCFPSLHVSNCLLLIQRNWHRRCASPAALLGFAIIASTVLVKQHYVVDVVGGIAVYLASLVFLRTFEIVSTAPRTAASASTAPLS